MVSISISLATVQMLSLVPLTANLTAIALSLRNYRCIFNQVDQAANLILRLLTGLSLLFPRVMTSINSSPERSYHVSDLAFMLGPERAGGCGRMEPRLLKPSCKRCCVLIPGPSVDIGKVNANT